MVKRNSTMKPDHLRSWRLHMGKGRAISMREAARLIGCNPNTYIKWENGQSGIPHYVDLACTALVMGAPPWSERTL